MFSSGNEEILSRCIRKPTICICENKGADQLRSNCEADQRLCFRYTDSMIPLVVNSEISNLQSSSVTVQPGVCRTWSEIKYLVFPCDGLFHSKNDNVLPVVVVVGIVVVVVISGFVWSTGVVHSIPPHPDAQQI